LHHPGRGETPSPHPTPPTLGYASVYKFTRLVPRLFILHHPGRGETESIRRGEKSHHPLILVLSQREIGGNVATKRGLVWSTNVLPKEVNVLIPIPSEQKSSSFKNCFFY